MLGRSEKFCLLYGEKRCHKPFLVLKMRDGDTKVSYEKSKILIVIREQDIP